MPPRIERKTYSAAAIFLGIGVAAFVDGIVLHMLLQWHHMVSHRYPATSVAGMRINTYWDGVFHLGALLAVIVAVTLLWMAASRGDTVPRTRNFIGLALVGAGLFNLVEGVVDHHVLQLHHVRDVPNPLAYDLTFLAVGGLLPLLLGWVLSRRVRRGYGGR